MILESDLTAELIEKTFVHEDDIDLEFWKDDERWTGPLWTSAKPILKRVGIGIYVDGAISVTVRNTPINFQASTLNVAFALIVLNADVL
ncbi:hypothetical protein FH593_20410 (plasmid) [Leptospira interrogans]|uniref:hypothetical protein n=1 Tax=Leptospira interrogans TaxID=173 RepID=UPI0002C036FD|nr:hypothetical protein [Leptospira interrogans]EMN60345.1 hypothetical protein LEP1GSC092_0039 [Leptospira interrogans serovar Pyrogenes str. R168]ULG90665.1 hypothetical protein FH593_20705 [Leptospira interrogans]ULG90694.1 hypothetical protein FH593_20410 [Leptospira interrogans]UML78406.1 hypothetical protein FH583_21685 [Leptospira interrogans]UML78462.1 hypothetical protein FH583_21535 [Leptospira interrogans]